MRRSDKAGRVRLKRKTVREIRLRDGKEPKGVPTGTEVLHSPTQRGSSKILIKLILKIKTADLFLYLIK